ncbi:class I SAM-dependent methyltransferase [Streptoalloteichus hindustanus]|uniref:Methyltransferase domain-containing protein n=1 Tax=Streptoalloteichus hindustanus TaxID=2017 RepID=A0A1M5LXL2_STRHI|nr:class I SAM-dependent methyltransferase [Streptoalloteichus hindustanus]SHG69389.1 Methyltransferase domain-containing protein [Streptoalloteichus hindustanus]
MGNPGHVRTFDRIAPVYDARYGRGCAPAHELALDAVTAAGVSPGVLLDVGCGTGRLLALARVRWPNARLLGVDPAPRMVAVAARQAPLAGTAVAAAEALPLGDASVDVVVSTTSFGHWADQRAGLAEVARVLRPGGAGVVVEHPPPGPVTRLSLWLTRRLPRLRHADVMVALASGAGLRATRCGPAAGFLVTVVTRPG